jgi:hypothetical protein
MRSSVVRRGDSPVAKLSERGKLATATRSTRGRERASTPPVSVPVERARPPIRLRFVLLFCLLGGLALWVKPRAEAAWKVHGLAVALADYGACMAGPTGAGLLRSRRMDEFQRLMRRRLVNAAASDAPFERCAALAKTLTGQMEAERAHRASAWSFAEYGGNSKAEQSLAALRVTPDPVAEAARRAWPFVRGYAALVKPSLGAKEAAHPLAAPEPQFGRGLPAARAYYRATRVERDGLLLAHGAGANLAVFRSSDGGATWKPTNPEVGRDIAGRCPLGPEGQAFILQGESNAAGTAVVSLAPGMEPHAETLAAENQSVLAMACDDRALVAAVRSDDGKHTTLRQCAFRAACADMPLPKLGKSDLGLEFPLDVARLAGTTVVAVTMGNVVRVASTRDSGASWTPFAVAYDGGEHPLAPARMPTQLLAVGKRLLLHGATPRSGETYALLHSDDQGASFRGR